MEERLGLHFEGKWQPSLDLEGSTPQHLHFSEPCWSETGGAMFPTVTAEGQGVRVVLQKMEALGVGTSTLQVGASRCRQSPAAVIDRREGGRGFRLGPAGPHAHGPWTPA